jgi:adenylylsulfate kinase
MIEKLIPITQHSEETFKRSLVKTISYRAVILVLDFTSIYLFTGQVKVAVGFMLVSNVYTTVAYFIHERVWGKIKWGKVVYKKTNAN